MAYDQKLVDEKRKYGAVTCSVCKKRTCTTWTIYSVNTHCSRECSLKWIFGAIEKANKKMEESRIRNE